MFEQDFKLKKEEEGYTICEVNKDVERIIIPSNYKGCPIIKIGKESFAGCKNLREVVIPDSVLCIDDNAFLKCTNLETVKLAENLKIIGAYSFWECSSLKEIIIPKGVFSIGSSAFLGCDSLENVVINEGVLTIGSETFNECWNLKTIRLPKSLKMIGGEAFFACPSLEDVYFDGNIDDWLKISMGSNPMYCASHIYFKEDNEYKELKTIIIPDKTTKIGENQFEGLRNVDNIIIPSSIESIGIHAFIYCDNFKYNTYDNGLYLGNEENPYLVLFKAKDEFITSCDINENTKIIYEAAFYRCKRLTHVSVPNGIKSIMRNAFLETNLEYNVYDNALYLGNKENPYVVLIKALDKSITSCDVNENTKIIYDEAFKDLNNLVEVKISEGLTSIGYEAFNCCRNLRKITLPSSLRYIDGEGNWITSDAFYGCSSLRCNVYDNGLYLGNEDNPYLYLLNTINKEMDSYIINENTRIIGSNVFNGCHNLKSIFIPKNVILISESAFAGYYNEIVVAKDNSVYYSDSVNIIEKATNRIL